MSGKDIQLMGNMKVAQSIVREALGKEDERAVNINIVGQIQVNKQEDKTVKLPETTDHVSPKLLADILDKLPEPRLDHLHALVFKAVRSKFTSKKECMRYLNINAQRYNSLTIYTHQRTKLLKEASEEA